MSTYGVLEGDGEAAGRVSVVDEDERKVVQADTNEFTANLHTIHGRLALRTMAVSLESFGEHEAAQVLWELVGREG